MMDISTIVRETLEAVKQDYVSTFPEGTQKLSDPFALTKILEPGLVKSATIFLQKCVEILNCEIKVKTDAVFFKWVESRLDEAKKTAEDGKPGSYSGAFIETDDFAAAALFGVSSPRLRGGSELLYVYPFSYFQTVCLIRYLQLRLAERRQTSDEPGNQAGKVKIEAIVNFMDLFNDSPDSVTAINALNEEITLKYNTVDVKIYAVKNGKWAYNGQYKASLILALIDTLTQKGKLKSDYSFQVVYKSTCDFFKFPQPAKEPLKARNSDVYNKFRIIFDQRL